MLVHTAHRESVLSAGHTKLVCCLQVGRRGPVCAGVQFNPGASPKNGGSPQDLSQLLESAHNCASYSISYTPASTAAGVQQPCRPVCLGPLPWCLLTKVSTLSSSLCLWPAFDVIRAAKEQTFE